MDDLKPTAASENEVRNEVWTMYALVGIVLCGAAYADIRGFYESLLSAFAPAMAFAVSITAVASFELSLAALCLGVRNLFAFKVMPKSSWGFYAGLTVVGIVGSWNLGSLLRANIHAVGYKSRGFTHAIVWENDPVLVSGRARLAAFDVAIAAAEKSIQDISGAARAASVTASSFAVRAADTTLTAVSRRDQLFNAGRAGKTQAALGSAMKDAIQEKTRLARQRFAAQMAYDSSFAALDKKYRNKAPEDFAEAAVGRSILANVSSVTVWASLLAWAWLYLARAYQSGSIRYRVIEYLPVDKEKPALPVASLTMVTTEPELVALYLPEKLDNETLDEYRLRIAQTFEAGQFQEGVTQKMLAQKLVISESTMTRLIQRVQKEKKI